MVDRQIAFLDRNHIPWSAIQRQFASENWSSLVGTQRVIRNSHRPAVSVESISDKQDFRALLKSLVSDISTSIAVNTSYAKVSVSSVMLIPLGFPLNIPYSPEMLICSR